MFKRIPLPLIAAGLGASLFAGAAQAERYVIDPSHTFARFEVKHLGLSRFTGRFDRTEGTVDFDPEAQTGSADITIHADSVSSGVAKLDEHLRNEDFFHVEKHPTLRFVGETFHFDGDQLVGVDGQLTLLGTTRPLTLKMVEFNCLEHPMKRVPACGGNAVATLKRSDFGMDAFIPAVSDEVRISIEVEAAQPAPEEAEGDV